MKTTAFFLAMLLTLCLSGVVSGQQKPTTGYAPVNGLQMYYEIHGSGEPVLLDYLKMHGDMRARSESRLAILPNTTHVTLMNRWQTIVPIINDFLDAKTQKQ